MVIYWHLDNRPCNGSAGKKSDKIFLMSAWLKIISVSVVCLLCSCATYRDVQVVQEEPENCTFLAELSAQRQCNDIVAEFKKETFKKGGDTLQCCWQGDVIQVLGVNPRTGQVCDYVENFSARAYSCKARPGRSRYPSMQQRNRHATSSS